MTGHVVGQDLWGLCEFSTSSQSRSSHPGQGRYPRAGIIEQVCTCSAEHTVFLGLSCCWAAQQLFSRWFNSWKWLATGCNGPGRMSSLEGRPGAAIGCAGLGCHGIHTVAPQVWKTLLWSTSVPKHQINPVHGIRTKEIWSSRCCFFSSGQVISEPDFLLWLCCLGTLAGKGWGL